MTEDTRSGNGQESWSEFVERTNEAFAAAIERNVEAQSRFAESWLTAMQEGSADTADAMQGGMEGYAKAYDVWMQAAEDGFERLADSMEGEDVSVEELRDIWLSAANESFKESLSTQTAATNLGESVSEALDFRQEMDALTESTLRDFGLATTGDVQEVGERLVEMERRQHAVEKKLDRILEAMEE
jgi:glycerate kinase